MMTACDYTMYNKRHQAKTCRLDSLDNPPRIAQLCGLHAF